MTAKVYKLYTSVLVANSTRLSMGY